MDQHEYDDLLRGLTALVEKLDARDNQILELFEEQQAFNRQQVWIGGRVNEAIERIDVTLKAIKDLLERGNGH